MTCKEIYELAMALMDEMKDNQSPSDVPQVDYSENKDYQARTPGIVSILQTQVIMYLKGAGADVDSLDPISTMDDEVDLEQDICTGVMPYGLAARLLGQEDTKMSSYFNNLYHDNLSAAKDASENKFIAKQQSRTNVYGLFRAGD